MRVLTVLLALCLFAAVAQAQEPLAGVQPATEVKQFHAGKSRSGLYVVPGLTDAAVAQGHMDQAFGGYVQGHIYAQPLYWRAPAAAHGRIIVATEANLVYALDSLTGAVIWRTLVGTPVAHSSLPCGDIDPVGITGTPVIDAVTRAVYFDAMALRPKGPRHLVYALALHDGSVMPGWPVNVTRSLAQLGLSFDATVQNQRSALLLVGGKLYVSYGAHAGDCGDYHGWVVGIDQINPAAFGAWSTRADRGGIWAPGGPVYDGQSIFVATGNTSGATEWGDGEAVIRLAPDLSRSSDTHDYFAPANWQQLDATDSDLGGTGPLPITVTDSAGSSEYVLALGKDGKAYLLDPANLGGIGQALAVAQVSNGAIITAPAAYPGPDGTYVVFRGNGTGCASSAAGLVALRITRASPPRIATAWCAPLNGAGAPIVTTTDGSSNPIVWVVGAEGDQLLHGFRGSDGAILFDGTGAGALPGVRRYSTLIAAEGRLYVAGDQRVFAIGFHLNR